MVSPLLYKDVPVMGQTGINVQVGTNTKIGVSPSLFDTAPVAKERFTPQQRKCYFPVSSAFTKLGKKCPKSRQLKIANSLALIDKVR